MKTIEEKIAVMQAFANGKEIEITPRTSNPNWITDPEPLWDWRTCDYRVKEKYVPFTFEDAEFLIGKIVKRKTHNYTAMIISCTQLGTSVDDWEHLLDDFTFLDGSPCGKLK